MVRQLSFHERKLLKHVDFLDWKHDARAREVNTIRRYHIQHRDDYHAYNKLCGSLRSYAHRLALLPAQDPFRTRMQAMLLSKLFDMGVLNSAAKLSDVENKLTVAAFCRRRLAVFMCMSKMAETVSAAVKFIEQGHVRVGPDTITDPAFLVTRCVSAVVHASSALILPIRHMEDFVTWVDTSKLKRTIMKYNDEVSSFTLLIGTSNGTRSSTISIFCSDRDRVLLTKCNLPS